MTANVLLVTSGKSREKKGSSSSASASEKMFSEENLKKMEGYQTGPDYIEVLCGCTSKSSDTMGRLRIDSAGNFKVSCECSACLPERSKSLYLSC